MALENKGLEVGEPAPAWELRTADGEVITSAQLRGKPFVLLFFRGTWCPSCREQMRLISENWDKIAPLANTVGIVGEKEEAVRDFLTRYPLPFPLLADPQRKVIEAHDVYQRFAINAFHIARPSTLIIDSEGIVRYSYVGSSQFDRPKLDEVIAELQKLT